MYVWTKTLNKSAHSSGVCAWRKSTETECQQKSLNSGRISHQKGVSVYKRNLVPSVHVVLHLRPCICSRSSYYWRLLLYKPGLGALSHSQTIFVGWSIFLWALNYKPGGDRERTQMLGLEWPYRGTCHTFPFWIIPHHLSAKNGQRRTCKERFNEGLSTILTCSSVWLWACGCASACVRERERDQGGVRGRRRTHQFVQCVCIDVWMTACVWETYFKHAAPDWRACVTIVCMCVCMSVSKCVGVCLKYMSISFLSQSCYSTFIPLVGLYPVLLCLWI